MNGTDPGARQHRIGGLRHHGHIDADSVALNYATIFQDIREPADFVVDLRVGQTGIDTRIIAFPDDRHLIAAGL